VKALLTILVFRVVMWCGDLQWAHHKVLLAEIQITLIYMPTCISLMLERITAA